MFQTGPSDKHRVVVSAENNPQMAWQAKLLHFSCVTRLGQSPIIIVHETERPWHPYFDEIIQAGGIVRGAPNFNVTRRGDLYSPRNTAGTLLQAAELDCAGEDFFVLCDPDMLFVHSLNFPQALSGDLSNCYAYLDYHQPDVVSVAQRIGVTPEILDAHKEGLRCGVPYVVPRADGLRLAATWLEVVDEFAPPLWTGIMYAFGLATIKLGMRITPTQMVTSNYLQNRQLNADIIHYSHGDNRWDKRHYDTQNRVPRVWEPTVEAPEGTVLSEILSQIRAAVDFYEKYRIRSPQSAID